MPQFEEALTNGKRHKSAREKVQYAELVKTTREKRNQRYGQRKEKQIVFCNYYECYAMPTKRSLNVGHLSKCDANQEITKCWTFVKIMYRPIDCHKYKNQADTRLIFQ